MPNPSMYSGATLAQGASYIAQSDPSMRINFTGVPDDGLPCQFTVGGWIRLLTLPLPATNIIFHAIVGGNCQISLDTNACIEVSVGGCQAVVSSLGITDLDWHYVGVQFTPGPSPDSGYVSTYLDGTLVQVGLVYCDAPTSPGQPAVVQLGASAANIELAAWSQWSVALSSAEMEVPIWGPPAASSPTAHDLQASWDFANGPAADLSGKNAAISVPQQEWHVPALSCTGGSYATASLSGTDLPGSGGPFSILAWTYNSGLAANSYYSVVSSENTEVVSQETHGVGFLLLTGADNSVSAQAFWPGVQETQRPTSGTLPANQWTHLALVSAGGQSTPVLYVNGVPVDCSAPGISSFQPTAVLVGPFFSDTGGSETIWIQDISIWSSELTANQILNYMTGSDPTTAPNCVACYPLIDDMGDTISGNSLTVASAPANQVSIVELTTPMSSSATALAPPAGAADNAEVPLYSLADLRAIAAKNGIDVTSTPDAATFAAGPYAEAGAWFETLLKGVPADMADRFRGDFHRNLTIGMQMSEKGILVGKFTVSTQSGDTVIAYNTEQGPQEVLRLTGQVKSDFLRWCLTIVLDTIGIVAAMFGIVTTAAKVTGAAGIFDDVRLGILGGIASGSQGSSTHVRAFNTIKGILAQIWEWKVLGTLIYKLLKSTWFSTMLTVLSLVAQIVAIVFSGGGAIAAKVATMGIAIGQLVSDLLHMPSSASAQSAGD